VAFVNVWGLHHDENKIKDPDVFNPDRYAGRIGSSAESANSADYENRDHYGFGEFCRSPQISLAWLIVRIGNGRRLCPGIHLADRNLWHAISKILWAFEVKPKIDPQTGKSFKLDTSVETGYREGLTM
jgi:cytochrome P450